MLPRHLVVLSVLILVVLAPKLTAAACLTTLPSSPPFTPPAPYPPEPVAGRFWFGSDVLWTWLPFQGNWASKGSGQKLFLWSRAYNPRTEPKPALIITGKRLDGDAPSLAIAGGTNAGFSDGTAAMLTGVTIPTAGCWELTGHYGGHTLTFVVSVGP